MFRLSIAQGAQVVLVGLLLDLQELIRYMYTFGEALCNPNTKNLETHDMLLGPVVS